MFASAFRIVAVVLLLCVTVLEVAGAPVAAALLQAFRDAGFASFIASFLF